MIFFEAFAIILVVYLAYHTGQKSRQSELNMWKQRAGYFQHRMLSYNKEIENKKARVVSTGNN